MGELYPTIFLWGLRFLKARICFFKARIWFSLCASILIRGGHCMAHTLVWNHFYCLQQFAVLYFQTSEALWCEVPVILIFFSAAFSDHFIPGLSWVPLPKNLHLCKVMAPFQTQVKLGSEGQIAVQGSRQTSIPETSRPGWEQRHNMTWPGTYNTQRPWVCDLMIWADNSCWSTERCLGPEHSYSEPILAPGFGNVKREVEKLALLLLLLLDNSRVRLFSCSKLPGHDSY